VTVELGALGAPIFIRPVGADPTNPSSGVELPEQRRLRCLEVSLGYCVSGLRSLLRPPIACQHAQGWEVASWDQPG